MPSEDHYCAACDKPTDRTVTEEFDAPSVPDIEFPLCVDCDTSQEGSSDA